MMAGYSGVHSLIQRLVSRCCRTNGSAATSRSARSRSGASKMISPPDRSANGPPEYPGGAWSRQYAVKACENMEHLKEAAQAAAAAAQVGTLSDPNKSLQNDRVLSTKDGTNYRITGDGKTADEYMTMEYLNDQLKAEGKFSHDGAENGWEYLRAQPKIGRMPDLVRVQWLEGHIVNVTRVDLIIRDSASTSVDQLKDKAGQTGRPRQADEVVVRRRAAAVRTPRRMRRRRPPRTRACSSTPCGSSAWTRTIRST
jgi:hypothetical protein